MTNEGRDRVCLGINGRNERTRRVSLLEGVLHRAERFPRNKTEVSPIAEQPVAADQNQRDATTWIVPAKQ